VRPIKNGNAVNILYKLCGPHVTIVMNLSVSKTLNFLNSVKHWISPWCQAAQPWEASMNLNLSTEGITLLCVEGG